MISREENERLTRVGAGTPGGALLRRYWQPLCPSGELTAEKPKKHLMWSSPPFPDTDFQPNQQLAGGIPCELPTRGLH